MTRFVEFECDECSATATTRDYEVKKFFGPPPGWLECMGLDGQTRHLCPRCWPRSIDVTEFVEVLGDGGVL